MYSCMARVSDLQRKVNVDARTKYFAASTSLLETLDSFALTKKDKGIKLIAYLGMFRQEFDLSSVFDIAQPLGDWLCSLPKGVWNDK